MHLDAGFCPVPFCAMRKGLEIEIGVKLAIETNENIAIEARSDSGCVVISIEKSVLALNQVHAEEKTVAGFERGADATEQAKRVGGLKVADARADIQNETPLVGVCGREVKPAAVAVCVVHHAGHDCDAWNL